LSSLGYKLQELNLVERLVEGGLGKIRIVEDS